jgi:excisionase family DNA binding protein
MWSDLMSASEVARRLGVSPDAVADWTSMGIDGVRLPATRVGRVLVVRSRDLDRFLKVARPRAARAMVVA